MAIQSMLEPEALNPDRPLRHRGTQLAEDDRAETDLLYEALSESCDYGQQLWHALYDVRAYLLDSLPREPSSSPRAGRTHAAVRGASPTGPDDEEGWQQWTATFAAVTSVLCGPRGDPGFALSRARHEQAKRRRPSPGAGSHATGLHNAAARRDDSRQDSRQDAGKDDPAQVASGRRFARVTALAAVVIVATRAVRLPHGAASGPRA